MLRAAGALFAYLHGSVVADTAGADSDVDVAAFFAREVTPWDVPLPGRVDLFALDDAPLEMAGRVALHGRLLFDDDPPRRVRWEADTRKIYLDERPRVEQIAADFAAGARARLARSGRG